MSIPGLFQRRAGLSRIYWRLLPVFTLTALLSGLGAAPLRAETACDAWLRYAPLDPTASSKYSAVPHLILRVGDSPVLHSAEVELTRGLHGMLGGEFRATTSVSDEPFILVGTRHSVGTVLKDFIWPKNLSGDGYWIAEANLGGSKCIIITAPNERGVLYGVFAFLSKIARYESVNSLADLQVPANTIRMIDQWDNLDGTIERGYAGASLFFEDGHVRQDLSRAAEYARLLASVGINACAINNVNANPRILDKDFLPQLRRVAEAFRPWGVRLTLSVDVSSPQKIGGLPTFDPLDPRVAAWWQQTADALYAEIPDFAGFVVKADSEGRPGPASYGRTPADAANVIARGQPTIYFIRSTANSPITSSSRSSMAPSIFRCANRSLLFSAAWKKRMKPSNYKSLRNTPASSGISVISSQCGRKSSISICATQANPRLCANWFLARSTTAPLVAWSALQMLVWMRTGWRIRLPWPIFMASAASRGTPPLARKPSPRNGRGLLLATTPRSSPRLMPCCFPLGTSMKIIRARSAQARSLTYLAATTVPARNPQSAMAGASGTAPI